MFFFIVFFILLHTGFLSELQGIPPSDLQDFIRELESQAEKGLIHRQKGEYAQATMIFEKTLQLARKANDSRRKLNCLMDLGILKWNLGLLKESAAFYKEALELSQELGAGGIESRSSAALKIYDYYSRGKNARQKGQYKESIAHFELAIELAKKIKSPEHELKCLRQLSSNYLFLEDLRGFYQANVEALELARKLNHRTEEGRCLNNIGLFYSKSNSYSKALAYLDEALEILRANEKDSEDESTCLNNIGVIYRNMGNFDRAVHFMKAALVIDRKLQNYLDISIGLNNLGAIYRTKGQLSFDMVDLRRSLDCYNEALLIVKKNNMINVHIDTLNNIGLVYFTMGDYSSSLEYFSAAKNLLGKSEHYPGLANLDCNLGHAFFHLDKLEEAENAFNNSIDLSLMTANNEVLWEAYFGLGRCLEKEQQYESALASYRKAVDAIDHIRSKLSLDDQKAGFARDKLIVYESLINLLCQFWRKGTNPTLDSDIFQVIEQAKARALLEGLSERAETLPDTGFSYYQEKQTRISKKISSTLSALSKKGVSGDLKNRLLSELESGEEEYLSLLNKIESQRIGKRVGGAEEIVTLSDIQNHMLDQKTAILEFFLGEKRSYAFFIAENTFRIEILPKREEIQDSLRGYLKLIASVPEREFRGELAAKRIYRDLIHPFENDLSSIENLVIVPDGILFYLPFETLVQDRNGVISSPAYLIERCCISYAPSVSSLKFLLNKKPGNSRPKRLLAFGNPVYAARPPSDRQFSYKEALREVYLENGFEFTPLVYSQKEVQQISRYFKKSVVDLYLGEKANEEAFKKTGLEDYQIIHFACHGFQDEKYPLRSALVLSLDDNSDEDGFLQGREIYHLRLNADLVVLSACQTARGRLENAEGVLGLPRVFFYAGAKSTISSLWKVNDRSTSELMRHFYGFLTEGKSKAQALRLAKLRLLNSKFEHPFYWAGFILSGDSRSIQ